MANKVFTNVNQEYVDLDATATRVLEVDSSGNPVTPQAPIVGYALEATQLGVKADLDERYSGGKLAVGVTLSTGGDNTVLTPTAGKALRVVWVSIIPSSDNTAAVLARVRLGAGSPFYQAYALAHWEAFQGAINDPLIVNLSTGGQPVAVTVHYREI